MGEQPDLPFTVKKSKNPAKVSSAGLYAFLK
jgi:hypothetical protein